MHRLTSVPSTAEATPRAGELRGAEVADDRGVREQEEGLGDQGQEGRDGEPQDLPVVSRVRAARRPRRVPGPTTTA